MPELIVTGVVLCTVILETQAATPKSVSDSSIPDFTALDDKAASTAVNKIVSDQYALEQELTSQLDAQKTPAKRKVLLIYALGQLRSRWAVPSLIKIVDFPAPFMDPAIDIRRWGQHPAVDALTAIGDPAVFRIIKILPDEKDPVRVGLLLMLIYQVEGANPVQARLEDALAAAHEDTAKQNLQNALKEYRTMVSQLNK